MTESRPPLPPFTREAATRNVRAAEDGWNGRNLENVALASTADSRQPTADSRWRNCAEFIEGREAIIAFLTRKWNLELEYRLIKELWGYRENRIAVRFAYEYRDDSGSWFRAYGNENWEFDAHSLMRPHHARINHLPIAEADRKFRWDRSGPRPADHSALTELRL